MRAVVSSGLGVVTVSARFSLRMCVGFDFSHVCGGFQLLVSSTFGADDTLHSSFIRIQVAIQRFFLWGVFLFHESISNACSTCVCMCNERTG